VAASARVKVGQQIASWRGWGPWNPARVELRSHFLSADRVHVRRGPGNDRGELAGRPLGKDRPADRELVGIGAMGPSPRRLEETDSLAARIGEMSLSNARH